MNAKPRLTTSFNLKLLLVSLLLGTTVNLFLPSHPLQGSAALAEESEEEPINPLEIRESDPLLPQLPVQRPFVTIELQQLEEALTGLDAQAAAQLAAGNGDKAFVIWYRELRLRRAMGPLEEIEALGRVGEIAWNEGRSPDVKIITGRLNEIQTEIEEEGAKDQVLLSALAHAYTQVRAVQKAVEVYEIVLANARQQNDSRTEEETLKALGELHLSWFNYSEAAQAYEALLILAQQEFDDFNIKEYLEQLAYIYDQSIDSEKQESVKIALLEKAIAVKQQLIASYQKKEEIARLLGTKISLAANYQALREVETASQIYQETFTLAWSQRQFARASEALQKLAELYQEYNQPDYALQIYQEQAKVQTVAGDQYGLMNTYDRIGLIYLEQEDYPQAIASFQSGLQLARVLSYREAYFITQIEYTSEKGSEGQF